MWKRFIFLVLLLNIYDTRNVYNSLSNDEAPTDSKNSYPTVDKNAQNFRDLNLENDRYSHLTDDSYGKERMLFRPTKDTDSSRALIPVANKGDEKHNFIDGNTIGIVIDPRTRKAVGILENAIDSNHNWKTGEEVKTYDNFPYGSARVDPYDRPYRKPYNPYQHTDERNVENSDDPFVSHNDNRLVKRSDETNKKEPEEIQEDEDMEKEGIELKKRSINKAEDDSKKQKDDRDKRDKMTDTKTQVLDKLETSGDLKVSGNKSPLLTKTDEDTNIEAKIQAKINAINDQVKRELAEQKTSDEKRTLLNEENKEIDPTQAVHDDLQSHIRRRRHPRYKRANAIVPYSQSAFLMYKGDDEDNDEGTEFDDDGFDDRTSNLIQKRQARRTRYDEPSYDYNMYPNYRKRANYQSRYLFDYPPEARRKRETFRHDRLRDDDALGGGSDSYLDELTRLKRVKRSQIR